MRHNHGWPHWTEECGSLQWGEGSRDVCEGQAPGTKDEGNMQRARKQQRRFHLELSPIRRGRIAEQRHSGLALSAYGRATPEPAPCASPGGRRRWGCCNVREAGHTVRPRTYCRCLRALTPPVSAVQPAHRPRCGGARKRRVRQTAAAASAPPRENAPNAVHQ